MSVVMGVSGEQGSFSEEAACLYAKSKGFSPTLRYLIDMEGVLTAISEQTITLGIFPVVNLQGGLVRPAFEAMGRHLFDCIDELWLPVVQCLLVLPRTQKQQIKRVVSHSQGLAQCRQYLAKEFQGVALEEYCDTAKAAQALGAGLFSAETAVIAAGRAASLYGLECLAQGIQDSKNNLTAFIIVKPHGGLDA